MEKAKEASPRIFSRTLFSTPAKKLQDKEMGPSSDGKKSEEQDYFRI